MCKGCGKVFKMVAPVRGKGRLHSDLRGRVPGIEKNFQDFMQGGGVPVMHHPSLHRALKQRTLAVLFEKDG